MQEISGGAGVWSSVWSRHRSQGQPQVRPQEDEDKRHSDNVTATLLTVMGSGDDVTAGIISGLLSRNNILRQS